MPWGCIRESLDGTSFASWANNRGFASASPDAAKAQATLESPWSEKSAQSSRRDAFAKSARWSDGAPGVPHAPLRRSSLCTPSASMPSALRRVRAAVATAHATLPTSCGLNWSSRRADSSTTASNRPGAWTSAVAKAQAVFARFCAMKRSTRGAAVFATAAKSSGASKFAVAKAQATFVSSWALNSSARGADSSPMRTMHRVAASARRISTGPRRWKRAFATRRGCNNLAAPHAALASARASQDEPPSSSSRDRARSSKAARRSASPEPA
mmetsp:Transcript_31440/g.94378  ORF Transcript_31440/g.94378 Transcript_31440/m.94378 type:complete len:270 (+) Transcript_31440:1209-2018(+)